MKQHFEIPLSLNEAKAQLCAGMQTDCALGKLLRSVKMPANDRRGLYGQIEGECVWAVVVHGYDMYPKRVFFGTLRTQGNHTILEGSFRYPMQVLLKLAVLLAWFVFGVIRVGVYTRLVILCEAGLCMLFFALLIVPGILINRGNNQAVREYFRQVSNGKPVIREIDPE